LPGSAAKPPARCARCWTRFLGELSRSPVKRLKEQLGLLSKGFITSLAARVLILLRNTQVQQIKTWKTKIST
jgi:hypothetical protein